jgi:large repetitive protein
MRLRQTLWASLLLTPLASGSALAATRGNYDAFLARQEDKSLVAKDDALRTRGLRVSQMEDRLGVPSFVWNTRESSSPVTGMSKMLGARKPDQAARAHLQSVADLYRLGSEDVSAAVLKSVHQSGKGPVIARFAQQVDGIEVFRNEVKVVMDRNLELVAVSGYLAPAQSARKASLGAASSFKLPAEQAIAIAFQDQTGISMPARGFVSTGKANGPYSHFELDASSSSLLTHGLAVPARAKQVYYTMPDGLVPAWYVEVNSGAKNAAGSDYHSFVVSAVDGSLLMRNNLSAHAGTSYRYKVWADATVPYTPYDGPQGTDGTPYQPGVPDGVDVRMDVPPNTVTLSSLPGNDPWLPAGATETVGNNVDAYADLSMPDGFQPSTDDVRATLTGESTDPGFDYPYDLTKAPNFNATQRQAAVTNLFYVTNWLHDSFYHAGFDEASGNAQAYNFGRGGVEGDRMRAEAQDYDGIDNANMSTPADGAPPRMQMFVFSPLSRFTLDVNTPTGLTITPAAAAFGAPYYDITKDVVVARHGTVTDGCSTAAFTNAADIVGKIALVDRGTCGFIVKAKNAQTAGAVGVIIANNAPGGIIPGGADASITVPVVGVPQSNGTAIKKALETGPVNVRMVKTMPGVARDGTLDSAIVAHEWGHYISNRLIGDANGLNNYQGSAMGEGWGDFHALMMQVREEDKTVPGNSNFQGVYTVSAYVTSAPGVPGTYYGIRRVPYSTSFSKNALTFKHIANGNPLPDTHPVSFDSDGQINSEVHNGGEVWATMLWECYVSLLNAHLFAEAQERMKQYLVAAYKATPSSPTYIEARDALLSVAKASDPEDYLRFANAFARRGMGFGAKAPDRDSQDFIGVVESYQAGNNLEVVSIKLDDTVIGCDQDGVLDVGETGSLTVTLRNVGAGNTSAFNATLATTGSTATFALPMGNTISVPALAPGQTTTRKLQLRLMSTTGAEPRAGITLALDEPSLPDMLRPARYDGRVNTDESSGTSDLDTVEAQTTTWTSSVTGASPAQPWQRVEEKGNRFWNGRDLPFTSNITLTSPWVQARTDADFIFRFKYRHSFETNNGGRAPWFDGSVVELTTDGIEWHNVFDYDVDPGYTAFIDNDTNPLFGEPGYTGLSAAFPEFDEAELDFGSALAGKRVQFRFRIGSDAGAGAHGLDVDDLQFVGIDPRQLPFGGSVREVFEGPADDPSAPACNRRPVAHAGKGPQEVDNFTVELDTGTKLYTTVKLDGSGSFDPDGDALTYTWTQLSGPPVTLTGADTARPTFVPRVADNASFVFQLVVNDSKEKSAPSNVTVYVFTDHDPVVNAGEDFRAPSRGVVTLSGAVADPDGDPVLEVVWKQTGGPAVTLKNDGALTTTFTAPDVKVDTELVFTLEGYTTNLMAEDTVKVVVHKSNRQPVVKGPNDKMVEERTHLSLDAEGMDADEDVLSYTWEQTGGPVVELSGADTATLSFTTPEVLGDTLMTFRLMVEDADGAESEAVTVNLLVTNVNRTPTALARKIAGGSVAGDSITLDGTGSTDPDGNALTYQWTQVSGPSVTLTPADGSITSFVSPKSKDGATLVFELTVSDGNASATHQVTVDVPKAQGGMGCSSTGGSGQSSMVSMLLLGAGLLFSRRRSFGRG